MPYLYLLHIVQFLSIFAPLIVFRLLQVDSDMPLGFSSLIAQRICGIDICFQASHDIELVGRIAMFFTKASIVLLYQRVFVPVPNRKTIIWRAIWFVFWWNLLYTIALILTVTTECVGKEDKVARGEECLKQSALVISATVINVVSDLMILVIPIVAIWGLQMAKKPKFRLTAVFSVGAMQVPSFCRRFKVQRFKGLT